MGRKLRIVIAAGVLLLVIAVILWLTFADQDQDPVYQGKPVSVWINEFNPAEPPTAPAVGALLQAGVHTTPALKSALRATDSAPKAKFISWLAKLLNVKIQIQSQSTGASRQHALDASSLLHTNVPRMTPALADILDNPAPGKFDPTIPFRSLHVLAQMGPDGINVLTRSLSNNNAAVQYCAANLLGTASGATNPTVISALQSSLGSKDSIMRASASKALRLILERTSPLPFRPWTNAPVLSGDAGNLWDVARGLHVTFDTDLISGFRAETVFGGASGLAAEKGAAIFQDGRSDGFVHAIEWATPKEVTIRSFGLIAHHSSAASDYFSRAFRSFKLLAWDETTHAFKPFHSESVCIPYGFGFCSTMLVVFRDLDKPVTAHRFRAEFVQNDGTRTGFGPRVTQLCAFPEPLNLPMVKAAVHNSNPTFQFGIDEALESLSKQGK